MKHLSVLIISLILFQPSFSQQTETLNAEKDNTIFSENVNLSLGANNSIFSGRIRLGDLRRALLQFDLSSIPSGATITDVSLQLTVAQATSGSRNMSIHSLNQVWGEGSSNTTSQPGQGTTATPDDATWGYTFWSITMWGNQGGDFDANALATTSVGGNGSYTWTSQALIDFVQDVVDGVATNNGFILIGDESVNQTAKRFNSREAASNQPSLEVTYSTATALSSSVSQTDFRIHPNPAQDEIRIRGNQNIERLQVLDLNGRLVTELNPNLTFHNISELKRGIYLLSIKGQGYSITKKLVKE